MEKRRAIFLIISLIGILMLLFLSQTLEPKTKAISEITEKNINEIVKIQGQITDAREYNNKTFQVLTIKDKTGNISAIMNANNPIVINKSKTYSIIGGVQTYNKSLQIAINKIVLE
jgi:DNA/RNA endonuclease YhcR with UshA esterase domain